MAIDALFEQLKHPNPHLRDRAMWELAETKDETIIPRLMAALDEEDTTYRRAAVKTLGAVGPDTVPPLVNAMLNSNNVTVRGSAVKAVASAVARVVPAELAKEVVPPVRRCRANSRASHPLIVPRQTGTDPRFVFSSKRCSSRMASRPTTEVAHEAGSCLPETAVVAPRVCGGGARCHSDRVVLQHKLE